MHALVHNKGEGDDKGEGVAGCLPHLDTMFVCCVYPALGWYCHHVVTEVHKHINTCTALRYKHGAKEKHSHFMHAVAALSHGFMCFKVETHHSTARC